MSNDIVKDLAGDYYVIESPEALKIIDEHRDAEKQWKLRLLEVKDQFGADGVFSYGDPWRDSLGGGGAYFGGLTFKGRAPAGWRYNKKKTGHVPSQNTKEGKALAEQLFGIEIDCPKKVFEMAQANVLFSELHRIGEPAILWQLKVLYRPRCVTQQPPVLDGFRRIEEWEFHKMAHEFNQSLQSKEVRSES